MNFAVNKIKKIMKKFIIIIAIAMFFVSCQKESKFIDVKINAIESSETGSFVIYTVINNSDMDINAIIDFKIDGTDQKEWVSDCTYYSARSEQSFSFISTGEVFNVEYKIKICE